MIGLVTNVNAQGVVRDGHLANRLSELLGSDGRLYRTRNEQELRQAMAELHGLGADVIATCGGDGTNLSTLTAMVHTWREKDERAVLPRFATLRGGTVNTIANNIGIHGAPEALLSRLLARTRQGLPIAQRDYDLIAANGRYGFLCGAGMPGRFFEAYYNGPRMGLPWAAVLAGRAILSGAVGGPFARHLFEPIPARVIVDGQPLDERRFTLLVGSTLAHVGLGFRPTYRAGTVPGRFHLIASSLPAAEIVPQLVRVMRGQPLRGQPHTDVLASRAELLFEKTQTYTFDGDLFSSDRITLASGPRVTMLSP